MLIKYQNQSSILGQSLTFLLLPFVLPDCYNFSSEVSVTCLPVFVAFISAAILSFPSNFLVYGTIKFGGDVFPLET